MDWFPVAFSTDLNSDWLLLLRPESLINKASTQFNPIHKTDVFFINSLVLFGGCISENNKTSYIRHTTTTLSHRITCHISTKTQYGNK